MHGTVSLLLDDEDDIPANAKDGSNVREPPKDRS
jgi:hypothetical protein